MRYIKFSRFVNLFAYLLIVAVNVLSRLVTSNGVYLGQVHPTALRPSPMAFFIWWVIYFLMLLFAVYQLTPSTYQLEYINRGITPFFSVSALFNVGWLIAQAYASKRKPWIQLTILYALLISIIVMYTRVYCIVRKDIERQEGSNKNFYLNYLFGRLWLSVYLAWVICLSSFDFFHNFFGKSLIIYQRAALMFGGVGLVSLIILNVTRDSGYGATIIWSAVWLAVGCINRTGKLSFSSNPVLLSSVIVAGGVTLGTTVTLILNISFCYDRICLLREEKAERRKSAHCHEIA